jgi:hypothetical protein
MALWNITRTSRQWRAVMSEGHASYGGGKERPFTLARDSHGQVVAIKGTERMVLGPVGTSCDEMCRFLAEIAFGEVAVNAISATATHGQTSSPK